VISAVFDVSGPGAAPAVNPGIGQQSGWPQGWMFGNPQPLAITGMIFRWLIGTWVSVFMRLISKSTWLGRDTSRPALLDTMSQSTKAGVQSVTPGAATDPATAFRDGRPRRRTQALAAFDWQRTEGAHS